MPSAYGGTDIISYLQRKYIIRQRRISYRVSDISLKSAASYGIILTKEGAFMSENKLLDLSFEFAVAIVNLVDGVTAPKSAYMTDQLARAGTSVGANIYEAQYAQSKKDFVAKLEIALKESNETSYWLKLMCETQRIDTATYQCAEKLCGNIRRLLIASCKTAKEYK
ncbi:MAG: four helix bundle protein [Ruminococcaceae bacterium]|nr:four helix bundle protein [Oscillospiraceae bacterium]